MRLYNQLHDLEAKRDSLLADARKKGSPAEERERLLKQASDLRFNDDLLFISYGLLGNDL